jgi:peptide chain release factor
MDLKSIARALSERMAKLGLAREDLEEDFIRGGGPGGQKINKTSSTVRLRHAPSGVEVRCQEERSLVLNRLTARERLCDILESRKTQAHAAARAAREKTRRQNRQKSPTQKRRMVEEKRQRAQTKGQRRRPAEE